MTGLAVHPFTGVLYGTANVTNGNATLYSIEPSTGAATPIGNTGQTIPDITFGPTGILYGWGEDVGGGTATDDLITIDLGTGATTVVGDCCGGVTFQAGLAYDSSSSLYMKYGDQLNLMNPATGTIISTQTLSSSSRNLLAFDPSDVLYTGTRTGSGLTLQTVNLADGVLTDLGTNSVTAIAAIAFVRIFGNTADLALDKMVDNASPNVGQNVVFTISVANAGPDDATGVVVTDQIPSGYTYVSDDGGGAYVSGTGVWTVGTIMDGNSATLMITATALQFGDHTNVAEVTSVNEFDPGDDQDSAVTVPVANADLSLTKDVSNGAPGAGTLVTFTLTVDNGGPDDATGVVVQDQLPSGYTYVSDDGGGTYNSATGVWTVGTILNTNSAILVITAFVHSTGTYLNSAQVTASDAQDGNSGNDQGSAITNPMTLAAVNGTIELIVNGPTRSAARSKGFVLRITNNGTAQMTVNNSNLIVSVNSDTSLASCRTFSKTLNPGRSTRVRCSFDVLSSGITSGDTVNYCTVLLINKDSDTLDNSAEVMVTAR